MSALAVMLKTAETGSNREAVGVPLDIRNFKAFSYKVGPKRIVGQRVENVGLAIFHLRNRLEILSSYLVYF